MGGWRKRYLLVDLSEKKISEKNIDQAVLQQFIGGKGLGTWLLAQYMRKKEDNIQETIACLVTGPLQGTVLPFSGRFGFVSKSPLTKLYLDSYAGGSFGVYLKKAGYDAIVIIGVSEDPCYLSIKDKDVEIIPGNKLYGKTTSQTEKVLKENNLPSRSSVLSIGLAGENLVPISNLVSDGYRTLSRGGTGAIFGVKKLKAIVVSGSDTISLANPNRVRSLGNEFRERSRRAKKQGLGIHKYGTASLIAISNELDQLPTKNFSKGQFDDFERISGDFFESKWKIKRKACPYCPLGCARVFAEQLKGIPLEKVVPVPEYESLAMFGANCSINDAEVLSKANHICNELGLDTISTGNIIAFLMECQARNLRIPDNTENLPIFGNTEDLISLINKIASVEGLGKFAGLGVRSLAKIIGQGSNDFAIHSKGLEMAAWDPRGKLGLGISYMTAAIGASHLRGWPQTTEVPNKPCTTKIIQSLVSEQNLKIIKDSLIICHFTHSIRPIFNYQDCTSALEAVTGVNYNQTELSKVAQRIWILARQINLCESEKKTHRSLDQLPSRLLNEKLPSGRAKGCKAFLNVEDKEIALSNLYFQRGCDEDGNPFPETLRELDLSRFQLT